MNEHNGREKMTDFEKLGSRSKSTMSFIPSNNKQQHLSGFLTGRTVKPAERVILPHLNLHKPTTVKFYNNRKLLSLPKIEQDQKVNQLKRTHTFVQSRPITNEKIYDIFVGKGVKKGFCQVRPIIDETIYPMFARRKGRSSSKYGLFKPVGNMI
ncbi:DgyrCDS4337 [Dimorphilus gyrociliatus]|uniref:DgyrCDS4337 n=1 Tax=Dimorphilus gyrociliatus TaxID=2664684 RepID=A0A7I8VLB8_9ANNE|nr:DgyrCDS4337 [Dimorphilus gyrociliatus]